MRYYAEILDNIVINIGTFAEEYYQEEEQEIIEITKEQFEQADVGEMTLEQLLAIQPEPEPEPIVEEIIEERDPTYEELLEQEQEVETVPE
jgi:uncharacterized protein YdbL (DUF1318 family)